MTVKDVASWMLAKLNRETYLYQDEAADGIQHEFGGEFVYENENGNLAISPEVLKAFKKLSGDDVVWERRSKMWRKREEYDEPGRSQP